MKKKKEESEQQIIPHYHWSFLLTSDEQSHLLTTKFVEGKRGKEQNLLMKEAGKPWTKNEEEDE